MITGLISKNKIFCRIFSHNTHDTHNDEENIDKLGSKGFHGTKKTYLNDLNSLIANMKTIIITVTIENDIGAWISKETNFSSC